MMPSGQLRQCSWLRRPTMPVAGWMLLLLLFLPNFSVAISHQQRQPAMSKQNTSRHSQNGTTAAGHSQNGTTAAGGTITPNGFSLQGVSYDDDEDNNGDGGGRGLAARKSHQLLQPRRGGHEGGSDGGGDDDEGVEHTLYIKRVGEPPHILRRNLPSRSRAPTRPWASTAAMDPMGRTPAFSYARYPLRYIVPPAMLSDEQKHQLSLMTAPSSMPQVPAVPPQHSPPPSIIVGSSSTATINDPCMLPQQIGNGPYNIPRWFYNPARMRCELFYWSGCCANANNFADESQCERACEVTHQAEAVGSALPTARLPGQVVYVPFTMTFTIGSEDNGGATGVGSNYYSQIPAASYALNACELELDAGYQPSRVGHAQRTLRRYYFNSDARLCQEFLYRGAGGNDNNFVDLDDCRRHCRESPNPCAYGVATPTPVQCQPGSFLASTCTPPPPLSPPLVMPLSEGMPSAAAVLAPTSYCHVGASPATTICCNKPPVLMNPCLQPLNIGVGNAQLNRFYYNPPAQQCQPFGYKGLQGNENNFLTIIECEAVCQVNPCAAGVPFRAPNNGQLAYCTPQTLSICPTGYYCHLGVDARTSVCCQALGPDPCNQPVERGQAGGVSSVAGPSAATTAVQRWYWDQRQYICLPFAYLGQKGTQNNFLTKEECERTCLIGENVNPCRVPLPNGGNTPLLRCSPPQMATNEPALTTTLMMNEASTSIQLVCGGRLDLYCHVGASPATTVCCPVEAVHPCVQPMERGVGGSALERWFHDPQLGRCQPFTYAGLKGNQNNFVTREECEWQCTPNPCPFGRPPSPRTCAVGGSPLAATATSTCPPHHWCHVGADSATTVCCPKAPATDNPCQLPMASGEGVASLERWYFDSGSTRQCRSFTYRGLRGNQNNFLSQRACQLACVPPTLVDNPCDGGQPALSTFSSSGDGSPHHPPQVVYCAVTNRDTCPVNFWCHLGATAETTVCCPGATNPCSVPLAPGTGNAGVQRWYYDADERECIHFQYNGKRGNQNNFVSLEECRRTCPRQLCLLSIDRGATGCVQAATEGSLQQTRRFAFDRQLGRCVPFDFTGCGGNLNNFKSMAECQEVCGALFGF